MALTIGLRYLFQRCVASDAGDYGRVEWPPHPARVFMALVATHFEDPAESDADRKGERDALCWLESLSAPELLATDGDRRSVVTHYVPPNDFESSRRQEGLQVIPEFRKSRQPRTFPTIRPHSECVYFCWPDAEVNGHATALRSLCRRVTRIGHSSSLVQMWVAEEVPADLPRWVPVNGTAGRRLRVTSKGLLEELEREYETGIRPVIGTWQGYGRATADGRIVETTVWADELVVLRFQPAETRHRWLSLPTTLAVTLRFREALIQTAEKAGMLPLPEWISGHQADGSPSERPHLAVLPLAFVGREHADGHLLGLGLAVPRDVAAAERRLLLRLVRQVRELKLGRLGRWRLDELTWELPPWNLQSAAWTGGTDGATVWGSATPVAFDRHPKARDRAAAEAEAAEQIAQACTRIGLPLPRTVEVLPVSPHLGAPAAHEFPRLRRKDGSERQHRHVRLRFDVPVCGPVVIGAGRYRGYGLCRPLREEEA